MLVCQDETVLTALVVKPGDFLAVGRPHRMAICNTRTLSDVAPTPLVHRDSEQIASGLKNAECNVFYDDFERPELWGKDLQEHLARIYRMGNKRWSAYCSELPVITVPKADSTQQKRKFPWVRRGSGRYESNLIGN